MNIYSEREEREREREREVTLTQGKGKSQLVEEAIVLQRINFLLGSLADELGGFLRNAIKEDCRHPRDDRTAFLLRVAVGREKGNGVLLELFDDSPNVNSNFLITR